MSWRKMADSSHGDSRCLRGSHGCLVVEHYVIKMYLRWKVFYVRKKMLLQISKRSPRDEVVLTRSCPSKTTEVRHTEGRQ